MAPPARFARGAAEFERFVRGFATVTLPMPTEPAPAVRVARRPASRARRPPRRPRSMPAAAAPARLRLYDDALAMVEHFGQIGRMTAHAFVAMFRRPAGDPVDALPDGVARRALHGHRLGDQRSSSGMVMAVQFAFGLQKFGGMEYTGRIIGLSFSRELAPTLTAVIVGGRIG